ncbi:MAG: hypothetical protein AAFV72_01090 [Cyanobacteria bacterium J06635_1]
MLTRQLVLISAYLSALALPLPLFAQTHPVDDAPDNPHLIQSSWTSSHGGPAQQASTSLPGPQSPQPRVQIRDFGEDAGKDIGTSPWHVLSERKYTNSSTARTIWGASLTDAYKYEIDGDTFRFVDSFELNVLPVWIGWNLFGLEDGRVIVPNPSGLRLGKYRGEACYGRHASLLVFKDGETSGSPIECVHKFEFSPAVVEESCGFRRLGLGATGVLTGVTYTGEIAVTMVREVGRGWGKRKESWLAVIDNDLTHIKSCAKVGDSGPSNMFPIERGAGNETIMYLATNEALVAMSYNAATNSLQRVGSVEIPYRRRTGTTPTLLGFSADRWIVTVDARCAVTSVFSGEIECDKTDTSASKLVAVRRPLGSDAPVTYDLPDFIDTVENSPAVAGNDIVIANYSGYTPDGEKDGKKDRATGVVKLSWNPAQQTFQTDWVNPDIQFSGVPTISTDANLVYGSGSEVDGMTYFYGLRLRDNASGPAGEVVVRTQVGPSTETRRGAKDAIYDAGSNILINDDASVIWPGGNSLVRILD